MSSWPQRLGSVSSDNEEMDSWLANWQFWKTEKNWQHSQIKLSFVLILQVLNELVCSAESRVHFLVMTTN